MKLQFFAAVGLVFISVFESPLSLWRALVAAAPKSSSRLRCQLVKTPDLLPPGRFASRCSFQCPLELREFWNSRADQSPFETPQICLVVPISAQFVLEFAPTVLICAYQRSGRYSRRTQPLASYFAQNPAVHLFCPLRDAGRQVPGLLSPGDLQCSGSNNRCTLFLRLPSAQSGFTTALPAAVHAPQRSCHRIGLAKREETRATGRRPNNSVPDGAFARKFGVTSTRPTFARPVHQLPKEIVSCCPGW